MIYSTALNFLLGGCCAYRPVGFPVDLWIRGEQWEPFTSNFCEAFSAVSHNILASKLRYYSLDGWTR